MLGGFGNDALRLGRRCRDVRVFAAQRLVQRLSVLSADGVTARDEKRQDVQRQFVGGKLNPTFREKAEQPP